MKIIAYQFEAHLRPLEIARRPAQSPLHYLRLYIEIDLRRDVNVWVSEEILSAAVL